MFSLTVLLSRHTKFAMKKNMRILEGTTIAAFSSSMDIERETVSSVNIYYDQTSQRYKWEILRKSKSMYVIHCVHEQVPSDDLLLPATVDVYHAGQS